MKKIILFALAAAVAVTNASAEGYQVNTLSAKQLGMAHTSVSQKLNSESVWFNPAAAAYQDQKFSIAAGVTGIAATATWEAFDGSDSQKSDNGLSTPLYLYLNYKVTDDLAVGLSVNTPYGSSMNWGNDGWAGAHLIQDISLQAYNVQPTVSYKLFNDKLSIGAGLMVSWGSVNLSKSLFPVGDLSNNTAAALTSDSSLATIGSTPLASITMDGDANVAFGVNVGLMYDLCDKWSIGASYRSKMMTVVDEGTTNIDFYNEKVEGLLTTDPTSSVSVMQNGTFAAELPLPSTLSVGVTYLPTDRWKIAAEMQMVGWSTYESLDFNFTSEDGEYVNSSPKGYENTFIYRLGAEYKATEWLTARAGIYFDESPVVSAYFAPETPSMNKIGYTCGLSVMPLSNRNFSIDLAYGYISPAKYDRSASYTSVDGLQYTVYSAYASAAALYEAAGDSATAAVYKEMADGVDYINTFGGNYRAVAHTFSVGLSWGF